MERIKKVCRVRQTRKVFRCGHRPAGELTSSARCRDELKTGVTNNVFLCCVVYKQAVIDFLSTNKLICIGFVKYSNPFFILIRHAVSFNSMVRGRYFVLLTDWYVVNKVGTRLAVLTKLGTYLLQIILFLLHDLPSREILIHPVILQRPLSSH